MLSWSGKNAGLDISVAAISDGDGDGGLQYGTELVGFVDAFATYDDEALAFARQRLIDAAGEAFMVDAAAVTANFEMMTRVADGTGARFDDETTSKRAGLAKTLHVDALTSTR